MNDNVVNNTASIKIDNTKICGFEYPPDCSFEVEYVNGMKEGTCNVVTSNGIRVCELMYHEDKVNGLCVFYDSEGRKLKEAMFENDIQSGWCCEYENGEVVFEGMYDNGVLFSELKKYCNDDCLKEEIRDGKTLCVCRLNDNHKKDGLCYMFEDGVLKNGVLFDNGIEKMKLFEFVNVEGCNVHEMIEFDKNGYMIYRGEYDGGILNGFKRCGNGKEFKYAEGIMNEMIVMKDGKMILKSVIKDNELFEYENDALIYEGSYCCDNGLLRNGKGSVWRDSTILYRGLWNRGIEKCKLKEISNNELIEHDEEGNVVYVGGYAIEGNDVLRRGVGIMFEYVNNQLKFVYDVEGNDIMNKRFEFESNSMIEMNDNGIIVYVGGYIRKGINEFIRYGEGCEYDDKSELLLYNGKWVNGNREGVGKLYVNGIMKYEGEWKDNHFDGNGKLYDDNGDVLYDGVWKKDHFMLNNRIGIHYPSLAKRELYDNGNVKYDGEWNYGLYEGHGIEYDKEGNVVYEGMWESGIPNGYGKCYNGGKLYVGNWKNGVMKLPGYWFDYTSKEKTSIVKWCCQNGWNVLKSACNERSDSLSSLFSCCDNEYVSSIWSILKSVTFSACMIILSGIALLIMDEFEIGIIWVFSLVEGILWYFVCMRIEDSGVYCGDCFPLTVLSLVELPFIMYKVMLCSLYFDADESFCFVLSLLSVCGSLGFVVRVMASCCCCCCCCCNRE